MSNKPSKKRKNCEQYPRKLSSLKSLSLFSISLESLYFTFYYLHSQKTYALEIYTID